MLVALATLAACAPMTNLTGPLPPAQAPPPPPAAAAPAPVVPPPAAPVAAGPRIWRVGLLVPLAGAPQQIGRDLLAAAEMALFDVADERFELLPRDSGTTTDSAIEAASRLIEEDRVDLILGPLLSDAVRATTPLARAAGIPLIAFTNDRAVASDGAYALGFAPQEQVRRVMGFARSRGFRQFAALVPSNDYGALMAASAAESATTLGVALAAPVYYPADPGDTTGRTEVVKQIANYDARKAALTQQRRELSARDDEISKRALKRLEILDTLGDVGFDALVLPAGGGAMRELAPLLAFYDVDPARVKLLGTWLWDDPALGKEPTLVGAWFAAPPPAARAAFVERFAGIHGRQPSRLATLGYDAVALAAVLARNAPAAGTAYSAEGLTSPNGFAGLDGIFRLLPDGRTERGLAVLELRPDGIVTIDAAPQSFEAVVN